MAGYIITRVNFSDELLRMQNTYKVAEGSGLIHEGKPVEPYVWPTAVLRIDPSLDAEYDTPIRRWRSPLQSRRIRQTNRRYSYAKGPRGKNPPR